MRKTILFAVAALMLTACSNDEPIVAPTDESGGMRVNPYRVSLDDALENADCLLAQISDSELTRSGKQRRVASIKYIGAPGTRSADTDTMLYLVNYEDNGGFALLSADSRLRPIYAISDEGSLAIEDTSYNKGLATFVRGVEDDLITTLSTPELDTTFNPPANGTVVKSVNQYVAPLLSKSQREWGQGTPYNVYCPEISGVKAPVGCTAVAVGLIMSYYKWPTSYAGYTFNWDNMNSGSDNNALAQFLYQLGNSENLNITYKATGSSASLINNAERTFKNMGYQDTGEMQSFRAIYITSRLSSSTNKSPVLCRGRDTTEGGHAWVIDGYLQYKYTNNLLDPMYATYTLGDYLYHCVWGWNGRCNGYFYWDDGFSGNPIEYEDDDSSEGEFIYNFNDNVMYLSNFTPIYN